MRLLLILLLALLLIVYLIPIRLLIILRDLRLEIWLLRRIEDLGLSLAILRWPWSRHARSALLSLLGVYEMPGSAKGATRPPR